SHLPVLPDGAALHVSLGAIGLGTEPTGRTLGHLLERSADQRFTSLDPNVRPRVFGDVGDRASYLRLLERLLPAVDLLKVSDEDLALLRPDAHDPLDLARDWVRTGPALVVVTRGTQGALALRPDGGEVEVAGGSVEVADTVGAGDAFTSGLLAWCERERLLDPDALRAADPATIATALRAAVATAALTCTRPGADPPRLEELTTAPWG
ncbi:MAG: PfkB family carbohydrate kinase, partial [Actinomycetota bacterium]